MIQVLEIIWISEEAQEAEVHLSDGSFTVVAFSHPCIPGTGHLIDFPLNALNVRDIYALDRTAASSMDRLGDTWEYRISGRVTNAEQMQISVGAFVIELDFPLPGDLTSGDYVSFKCDRLDLY